MTVRSPGLGGRCLITAGELLGFSGEEALLQVILLPVFMLGLSLTVLLRQANPFLLDAQGGLELNM